MQYTPSSNGRSTSVCKLKLIQPNQCITSVNNKNHLSSCIYCFRFENLIEIEFPIMFKKTKQFWCVKRAWSQFWSGLFSPRLFIIYFAISKAFLIVNQNLSVMFWARYWAQNSLLCKQSSGLVFVCILNFEKKFPDIDLKWM